MTVRNLLLAPSGDLAFVGNNLALVSDGPSIAQAVRCRLQTFQGEWYLDPTLGVPYYQSILGKQATLPAITAIFQAAIEAIEGVTAVTAITLNYNHLTRNLIVSWSASTNVGLLSNQTTTLG